MNRSSVSRHVRPLAITTLALRFALPCGNTTSTGGTGGTPKAGGKLVAGSWQEQDSILAVGITSSP